MWRDFPDLVSVFVNCDFHRHIWKWNSLMTWCLCCFLVMDCNLVPGEWWNSAVVHWWGQQWKHLMSSACPTWENCTWCQRLSKSYVVYLFTCWIWWDHFSYLFVPNHSHFLRIKQQVLFMHTRLPVRSAFYGIHLVILFHPSWIWIHWWPAQLQYIMMPSHNSNDCHPSIHPQSDSELHCSCVVSLLLAFLSANPCTSFGTLKVVATKTTK